MFIFVIGFIGSRRLMHAAQLAEAHQVPVWDLATEIESRHHQTIKRMVMTMGEHELRNKEYETLVALLQSQGENKEPVPPATNTCTGVVACTDDVLLDPMSADILRAHHVVVVREDPLDMFARAKGDPSLHYAFLLDQEEKAQARFLALYTQRQPLYDALEAHSASIGTQPE